ncbi:hypothetical protein P7F88_09820 [Vibrio hannami]|nr:hypothetical protein [Vibrio hannami]MDG3086389.1 hypothetical protein [Vibrio hannami]
MYPPKGGIGVSDEKAERVADSMVDRAKVNEIDSARLNDNTNMYAKLLIAGIPALLGCVVQSLFF